MAGRKYASDYQVSYFVAADGKRRERWVYCGVYYAYLQDPVQIRRLRTHLLLSAGGIIGLLLPLFWNHTGMDAAWYIILPAAFAAMPLYALLTGAWRLRSFQTPFTREHRDKTDGRLRKASVWLTVLLGLCCAGCWFYWGQNALTWEEWGNMVCLHLTLPICAYLLTQRKKAATTPVKK